MTSNISREDPVFPNVMGTQGSVTTGDLVQQIGGMANQLVGDGLVPADVVAQLSEKE